MLDNNYHLHSPISHSLSSYSKFVSFKSVWFPFKLLFMLWLLLALLFCISETTYKHIWLFFFNFSKKLLKKFVFTFEWWLFTAFWLFNESMQKRVNLQKTGPILTMICCSLIRWETKKEALLRLSFQKSWHTKATQTAFRPIISF